MAVNSSLFQIFRSAFHVLESKFLRTSQKRHVTLKSRCFCVGLGLDKIVAVNSKRNTMVLVEIPFSDTTLPSATKRSELQQCSALAEFSIGFSEVSLP